MCIDISVTPSNTLTSVTIPTASDAVSGVVSTGVQTFAGAKTFSGDVTFSGTINYNGNPFIRVVQNAEYNIGSNTVVKYSQPDTPMGGITYSSSTGIFTIPKSGYYSFELALYIEGIVLRIDLRINGTRVKGFVFSSSDDTSYCRFTRYCNSADTAYWIVTAGVLRATSITTGTMIVYRMIT